MVGVTLVTSCFQLQKGIDTGIRSGSPWTFATIHIIYKRSMAFWKVSKSPPSSAPFQVRYPSFSKPLGEVYLTQSKNMNGLLTGEVPDTPRAPLSLLNLATLMGRLFESVQLDSSPFRLNAGSSREEHSSLKLYVSDSHHSAQYALSLVGFDVASYYSGICRGKGGN